MKIMIATALSAYSGKDEAALATELESELTRLGHAVDRFFLPICDELLSMPEQFIILKQLDVGENSDLLITIGYPVFAMNHKRKIVFLLSMLGLLYEGWDTEYGVLGSTQYASLRASLQKADEICLREAESIYCGSHLLAQDIKQRCSVNAEVIQYNGMYSYSKKKNPKPEGSYIVSETNLSPASRVDILLEAIQKSGDKINLVLFIPAANEVYMGALNIHINNLGLKDQVIILQDTIDLYTMKHADAYVCMPFASRQMPFSALYAMQSGVPVITTQDSGCLVEYIEHNKNGLICNPKPMEIAEAMLSIIHNKKIKDHLSAGCMESTQNFCNIGYIAGKMVMAK